MCKCTLSPAATNNRTSEAPAQVPADAQQQPQQPQYQPQYHQGFEMGEDEGPRFTLLDEDEEENEEELQTKRAQVSGWTPTWILDLFVVFAEFSASLY